MNPVTTAAPRPDPVSTNATVGEIAAALAGATSVFRRHKIDFCCGGGVSLEDAAAKRGVDPQALRAELSALAQVPPDAPAESAALCDHIVRRYHDAHRAELPELVRLARRVETVHREHADAPLGLADTLDAARRELQDHMEKEERMLFPAIRSGYAGPLFGPISVMRHEHDQHAEAIAALQRLTHGFQPPVGACRSWQALYTGVEKLVADLTEHMHLENNVLFPRFEG